MTRKCGHGGDVGSGIKGVRDEAASVGGYYEAGDQGGGNFTFVGTPSAAVSIDAGTPPAPVSVDLNAVSVVGGVVTIETTTAHGLPVAVAGPPTVRQACFRCDPSVTPGCTTRGTMPRATCLS